uniref:Zf-CHCC domain-containing protein n=1 Tax=Angiostrongylus cantonensis TaxID=6313 RepID=A0A0K0D997_ANGCA
MKRSLLPFKNTCSRSFCSQITKAKPLEVTKKNAEFDQVTHTGQAWDQGDYRLQRFDISKKQVNPNIAMHLIAERPPKDCGSERVVFCDGGHAALGHPRIFINLDKPGLHVCGYCGNRFYNSHVTKGDDMKIEYLIC